MQSRTEPTSTLASRLANVLIGELAGRRGLRVEATTEVANGRDDDAYASIEIVREAASANDAAKTLEFRRETTDDLVTTIELAREAMDADDRGTLPFVRFSAPYELIDIQHAVKSTDDVPQAKTSRRVAVAERTVTSYVSTPLVRSIDANECDTLRFVRYTAPYELVDLQHTSQPFVKITNEVPEARPSGRVAAVECTSSDVVAMPAVRPSGSLEAAWFVESDDANVGSQGNAPSVLARPVLVLSLLVGALAFGVGVGFLVI